MWKELISVLMKILDVYKQLLILSNEKRMVIVKVQMKELEKIVRQEQGMIAAIGKLEQQRETVLTALLAEENISAPNQHLLDLVMFCDEKTGNKITELHQQFKKTLGELDENNKMNNHLLTQALSVVNYNLNLLSETSVGPTYAQQGREQVSSVKRFDYKA